MAMVMFIILHSILIIMLISLFKTVTTDPGSLCDEYKTDFSLIGIDAQTNKANNINIKAHVPEYMKSGAGLDPTGRSQLRTNRINRTLLIDDNNHVVTDLNRTSLSIGITCF
jgi:hypothetical protein